VAAGSFPLILFLAGWESSTQRRRLPFIATAFVGLWAFVFFFSGGSPLGITLRRRDHNSDMTEAVIVALGRSPIGRARKGSLVDVRPDDPGRPRRDQGAGEGSELDRDQIEDLICGCGLPGGEQGHNIGRVVSILARLDVPGVTVNRYCSSSLMTTRMAAHAIEAGEGDVFLSVGVDMRCPDTEAEYPDAPDTYNPRLVPGNTEEYPDIYIALPDGGERSPAREDSAVRSRDRYAVKEPERRGQSAR